MEKNIYSESSSETETEEDGDNESEEQEEEIDSQSFASVKKLTKIKVKNFGKATEQKKQVIIKKDEKVKISTTKVNESSPSKAVVKKKQPGRSSLLTGRGVTTHMLIEEQIIDAGEKCLSINYLGRKFIGDLNKDGTIECHSASRTFSSPSAWAMHCKKQVNPDKKSGCGWASVKYKGRKLDEFKSTWFRKQKIAQAVAASSENDSMTERKPNDMKASVTMTPQGQHVGLKQRGTELTSSPYVPPSQNYLTFSEALHAVQSGKSVNSFSKMNHRTSSPSITVVSQKKSPAMESAIVYHTPQLKAPRKRVTRTRVSVKHSAIQPSSDGSTLVECAQFQSIGKIQPFSISISTSTLLLIDFHCHLTSSEVSGYLAGKWDSSRQHLRATKSYPIKYLASTSQHHKERVEEQIRDDMESHGLMLLGWYHSHPSCQPDPSLNDIKSQQGYQQAVKDSHYQPCIGLIISPYDSYKKESDTVAFWVRQPNDMSANQIGLPLSVRFTTHQDQVLSQDLINEMVALVNYYRNTADIVKFTDIWSADSSYLDKLKHSVIRKFPQDQTDGRFLDFIHKMLMAACS